MKWVLSFILFLTFIGCISTKQANIPINIPELNVSEYYDSPYIEGWKKLKEGKSKIAMEKFLQSNLEDEKLFLAFGYTFLMQDKVKLARQNFEKTLLINPDNTQAELGIATIYELTKDMDMAFQAYSRLRAKYPENSWIKVRYEYIKSVQTENQLKRAEEFKNKNNQQAYIQSLEKAASYSDDLVEIKMKIADFYYSHDDFDKATRYYEKILEKFPDQEDILLKLARAYEKMGKYDAAIVFYNRILEKKPGDVDLRDKISEVKSKFYDLNLPTKFKNIFFKYYLNREDLAALIGHYFSRYLKLDSTPIIITDISGSFARDEIIQLCTLHIMDFRPDHRFERFTDVSRSAFAVVLHSLSNHLEKTGFSVKLNPPDEIIEPVDISPLHRYYSTIKFMVNAQILKLDSENRFNPTDKVSPSEAMAAIRKLLNNIYPSSY